MNALTVFCLVNGLSVVIQLSGSAVLQLNTTGFIQILMVYYHPMKTIRINRESDCDYEGGLILIG